VIRLSTLPGSLRKQAYLRMARTNPSKGARPLYSGLTGGTISMRLWFRTIVSQLRANRPAFSQPMRVLKASGQHYEMAALPTRQPSEIFP